MSRKSGYPCPKCGRIAYKSRFPQTCPFCGAAYASSTPIFYDEPFPEIDPDFIKAQQEKEKAPKQAEAPKQEETPKAPQTQVASSDEGFEKYCPSCGLSYPKEQRRCEKCHRVMVLRPKVVAPVAPEQHAPVPAPQPQVAPVPAPVTSMKLRCQWGNNELVLLADSNKKILGRGDHPGLPGTVSSRHLVYYVEKGKLVIMDNGSTNGTYIDGLKLAKGVPHVVVELGKKGFFTLGLGQKTILRVSLCA